MSSGRISTPKATMDILDLSSFSLIVVTIWMFLGSSVAALLIWAVTRMRRYVIGYWNILLAVFLPNQLLALGSVYLEAEGFVPKESLLPIEFTAEAIRLQIVLNIAMIVVQSILLFLLAPDVRYGPLSPIRWMGIILSTYALIILIAIAIFFTFAYMTSTAQAQTGTHAETQTAGFAAALTERV